jgi:hypothetical protein
VKHCQLIRGNYIFLLEKLDVKYSSLVAHLYDSDVLSCREREDIEAELTSTRQNQQLLAILSRKSSEHFDKFLEALDQSGQEHTRDKLTGRQHGTGRTIIQQLLLT